MGIVTKSLLLDYGPVSLVGERRRVGGRKIWNTASKKYLKAPLDKVILALIEVSPVNSSNRVCDLGMHTQESMPGPESLAIAPSNLCPRSGVGEQLSLMRPLQLPVAGPKRPHTGFWLEPIPK